ncbi:unnamed protein product [Choristocarpus tenellus]
MLLARLDALERLVYTSQSTRGDLGVDLGERVKMLSKSVSQVERGNKDLNHINTQAMALGMMEPGASFAPGSADTLALKESALLAAKDEVDRMACLLGQVKALQEHINPPYLQDISDLSRRLSRLEAIHLGQSSETAVLCERAERLSLNYAQAVSLVSEKFVYYDDQLGILEQEQWEGSVDEHHSGGAS